MRTESEIKVPNERMVIVFISAATCTILSAIIADEVWIRYLLLAIWVITWIFYCSIQVRDIYRTITNER